MEVTQGAADERAGGAANFATGRARGRAGGVFCAAKRVWRTDTPIEVTPEDLPGEAEQEGANLVALAMQNNTDLQVEEADVRAKEFRLNGEKRGYCRRCELVGIYSLLGEI